MSKPMEEEVREFEVNYGKLAMEFLAAARKNNKSPDYINGYCDALLDLYLWIKKEMGILVVQ